MLFVSGIILGELTGVFEEKDAFLLYASEREIMSERELMDESTGCSAVDDAGVGLRAALVNENVGTWGSNQRPPAGDADVSTINCEYLSFFVSRF